MKEVIGVFKATNGGRRKHLIYITQDIKVNRKKVITSATKIFTLDSEDGQEVLTTGDPNIFRLVDGTTLKKVGGPFSG